MKCEDCSRISPKKGRNDRNDRNDRNRRIKNGRLPLFSVAKTRIRKNRNRKPETERGKWPHHKSIAPVESSIFTGSKRPPHTQGNRYFCTTLSLQSCHFCHTHKRMCQPTVYHTLQTWLTYPQFSCCTFWYVLCKLTCCDVDLLPIDLKVTDMYCRGLSLHLFMVFQFPTPRETCECNL